MELTLDDKDLELVQRILGDYLPNLREEIGKTDNFDWREAMKQDEVRLRAILGRLGTPVGCG